MKIKTLLASLLCLAGVVQAETIKVGAAVSLKEAFGEIAKSFKADTGNDVEFVFGSSGQVATQVKSGAPIDAFVSAANKQVDDLEKDGTLDKATQRTVAGNDLVLIVPTAAGDHPKSFDDLKGAAIAKVAVGEPKTVPAGQYAAQVLKSLGLDDALKGKLVYGSNVRQVLAYVERGEVSAGLVYATDAKESGDKVSIVATADAKTHEPIVYPAAVVAKSEHAATAAKFLDYLATDKATAVLKAKGFTLPTAKP